MLLEDIHFSRLTVGDSIPVAEGYLALSTGTTYSFQICWGMRQDLYVIFPDDFYLAVKPTTGLKIELTNELLREYRRKLCRAVYGQLEPKPFRALAENLKVLRIGRDYSLREAAQRLDIRTNTLNQMEAGLFDLEEDLVKYVDPNDSLLYRTARLYGVRRPAIVELSTPYFFTRNQMDHFCYDIGNNIHKILKPRLDRGRKNDL